MPITFTFSNQEIFISRLNNVCTFKIDGETISSIDLTYENGYLKSITKYLHYRGENNTIIKKDVVNKEYVFNDVVEVVDKILEEFRIILYIQKKSLRQ